LRIIFDSSLRFVLVTGYILQLNSGDNEGGDSVVVRCPNANKLIKGESFVHFSCHFL
jgi:hypothetical protein